VENFDNSSFASRRIHEAPVCLADSGKNSSLKRQSWCQMDVHCLRTGSFFTLLSLLKVLKGILKESSSVLILLPLPLPHSNPWNSEAKIKHSVLSSILFNILWQKLTQHKYIGRKTRAPSQASLYYYNKHYQQLQCLLLQLLTTNSDFRLPRLPFLNPCKIFLKI
jgi:hypothetical protein